MNESTRRLIRAIKAKYTDLLADAAAYLLETDEITPDEYDTLGRWWWTQQGDYLICGNCHKIVHSWDYDYKEQYTYKSLKDMMLCEDCARAR